MTLSFFYYLYAPTGMSAEHNAQRCQRTVGFTLTFLLVASSSQAKMCPERLPEPANAGPQAGGRRASSARSGRARDPTEWSRAQQVKLVVCRFRAAIDRPWRADRSVENLTESVEVASM